MTWCMPYELVDTVCPKFESCVKWSYFALFWQLATLAGKLGAHNDFGL